MVSWTRKMWRTVSVASTCKPIVPRNGASLGAAISEATGKACGLTLCASAASAESPKTEKRKRAVFTNVPPARTSMEIPRKKKHQRSSKQAEHDPLQHQYGQPVAAIDHGQGHTALLESVVHGNRRDNEAEPDQCARDHADHDTGCADM